MYCTSFSFHDENDKIEFRKHLRQKNIIDIEQWNMDALVYLFDI